MKLAGSWPMLLMLASQATEPAAPTRDQVVRAIRTAIEAHHGQVARHGGYVWRSSLDLSYRRGEAVVEPTEIWVQPPGTPSVGLAMLRAYQVTGNRFDLEAARDAAYALCKGQMRSGGWNYWITFDPTERARQAYRVEPDPGPQGRSRTRTTLDDDTTQAALRFLIALDDELDLADPIIHDAVTFGLDALMIAQHPNGGWSVNWYEHPSQSTEPDLPVISASYPDSWPRRWPNAWTNVYVLNDHLMRDTIETFLLAYQIYGEDRYLQTAKRGGDFLILAQMPDPQPAWAQQYDARMHPVWARKFEPPAISGSESQSVLEILLRLTEVTGDPRYLEPIEPALNYLRNSLLDDGRLARFYELGTNRPLYFTKEYQLTDDDQDLPTHYTFQFTPKLDRIASSYRRLRSSREDVIRQRLAPPKLTSERVRETRKVIANLSDQGYWVDRADNGTAILESMTFLDNLQTLTEYLQALDGGR